MASGWRAKARLVLFVEDNLDIRELYAMALRDAGLLVDEVSTLAEAMEVAPALRPDIIVLDRHLPDGDGWDVARLVKADEVTRATPIIGFTSASQRSDVENALVAGCDVFLEKPCSPIALVRHVRGMLGLPLDDDDDRQSGVRKLA
jgi:twitching motility two-component system response regulator PilH